MKRQRRTPGVAPAESPLELLGSPLFVNVLDRIESGANAVSQTRHAKSDELQDVAREIANLEAWLSETPELRPLGSFARHVKLCFEHLIGVFDTILEMLDAPTIADAQRLESVLQQHFDDAADAVSECGALADRIADVLSSDNPAATWVALAIGDDIASAGQRGEAILEGHGLQSGRHDAAVLALMWDLFARSMSDSEAFWKRVSGHYALLAACREAVIEISRSDTFAQRAADTLDDLLHAARLAITQGDPESRRQQATDLLDFGHRLVEQPLKLHLGIACAATTTRSFETTQALDVSEMANIASQRNWGVGSLLGSSDVRNAFAHRDYRVRADGMIELCPAGCARQGRPVSVVSLDDLCDAVLAISEACGVMDAAYALITGRSVTDADDGLPPFLIRTVAQGLVGLEVTELRCLEDTAIIEARGALPVKFAPVAALASMVNDYETLTILLTASDGGLREVRVPTTAFNAWSQCKGEVPKTAAFFVACHETLVDGSPAATGPQARKAIAVQTLECLADRDAPFGQLRDDFVSLREAAKAIGDRDLYKAIAGCIGGRATAQAGHLPANTQLDRLVAIAAEEVEPFTEWIVSE